MLSNINSFFDNNTAISVLFSGAGFTFSVYIIIKSSVSYKDKFRTFFVK